MRYTRISVSILAAILSVFVIGTTAQRSPQNSRSQQNRQVQTAPDQSNPGAPNGGYIWYGGCGPGMMGYGMMGQGMMGMMGWGNRSQQGNLNLSTSDVKGYLERWIATMSNPRLKAGPVTEKDSNTITADVVTVDKDALVQRFSVDRHTGFWQPVQ